MPPIKPAGHGAEAKRKKGYYNASEFKQILKQTFASNSIAGAKKGWVPPAAPQFAAAKKGPGFKKTYVSPYSQKAILQPKPIG